MEGGNIQLITVKTVAEAMNNPHFSFIESFADAGDIAKVTNEMTRLLFLHRRKREQLKERERNKVNLIKDYESKKRTSYIKHSATSATEKNKTILVDIETEKEKFEIDVVDQKIKELARDLSSIKLEIDTWKAISYSLRTEMGSF